MNYMPVINFFRDATGCDGWMDINASKPPSEWEKTRISMILNPEVVQQFKERLGEVARVFFERNKEFDYMIGMPVGAVQLVYEIIVYSSGGVDPYVGHFRKGWGDCNISFELYGFELDYEVLGFESLASCCRALDGNGFYICRINENYILLPELKPWYLPEAEPDFPQPRGLNELEYPRDVVDFNYVLHELDHREYIKEGEVTKIVIMNYENPLRFNFLPEPLLRSLLSFRKGLSEYYLCDDELTMPREFIRPGHICAVAHLFALSFICVFDRGIIIDIINETTVGVLLIDLGKKILAPMNTVKFLHKQFATFPIHGLAGTLAGLVPRTEELGEGAKDRMTLYLNGFGFEAEIYNADYNEPLFSLIIYRNRTRRSLNKHLIDTGDFRLAPLFPADRLVRGVDKLQTKPEFEMYDEPGVENPNLAREYLLDLDSEGDIEVDDIAYEEIERPTRSPRDPWTPLPESQPRIRPSPSVIRPRPIVDANMSSLALGPVRAPPNTESDAPQSDTKSSKSEDLEPKHLPLEAKVLALQPKPNENVIVETGPKPKPFPADLAFEIRALSLFPPDPPPLDRSFFLSIVKQREFTPSGLIKSNLKVIPFENSDSDSDGFINARLSEEKKKIYLKRAPWANRKEKGYGPEEDSEEENLNVDRDKLIPPGRCTFFDVPKARTEVSSDSTESELESENYTKDYIEILTDEEIQEEMELNMLAISLLATNQIVRDVARQRPERAYPLAKEWAKFALETNDSSLPGGALFNPFDKLREDLDEELALKYQLLAQMVPGFIYDEYAALAASTPLGNPSININPRQKWKDFLSPKNNYDPFDDDEKEERRAILQKAAAIKFEPTYDALTIEATESIYKKRYKLVSDNMELFVSKEQLKLLCVFPQLEIEERIKHCRRFMINWRVDTPNDRVEFQRFRRFFIAFITLHKHVDRFLREAKRKRIFSRRNH